jgi:hypothetical protein
LYVVKFLKFKYRPLLFFIFIYFYFILNFSLFYFYFIFIFLFFSPLGPAHPSWADGQAAGEQGGRFTHCDGGTPQVRYLRTPHLVRCCVDQCCGSTTFWGGSGSGSADPCLWLMDPDPDPYIFVDLQDASKKPIFWHSFFCLIFVEGTFTSFFKDKKSKRVAK